MRGVKVQLLEITLIRAAKGTGDKPIDKQSYLSQPITIKKK